jgi:hypothetical protein
MHAQQGDAVTVVLVEGPEPFERKAAPSHGGEGLLSSVSGLHIFLQTQRDITCISNLRWPTLSVAYMNDHEGLKRRSCLQAVSTAT